MITVTDFHKTYGDFVAVNGISFCVEPGHIMGLVGPNGAGKTTTLRAISGIIPPAKGTLGICGYDIQHDQILAKARMAYVPDDPQLFDSLTVTEHIAFSAAVYKVKNADKKADELIELFDLKEKKDTLAQELSRGMRQKVAVCCAYIHDPEALLFDEPLVGLDPRGIRNMKDSIVSAAQNGASVIISSHMLSLVEDLCSDLLILHKGECLFFGPMENAREQFNADGDETLEEVFFRATENATATANGGIGE